jgi:maltooligosyltrehalose trehalohydrolase
MSHGRLKIAAALVLTAPFIPMLFQGEEWGASTPFLYFTDHQDPKLGEAVRQGRRREFAAHGWDANKIPDPQARETFERSKLDWAETTQANHAELLDWHKRLIALRRAEPALRDGRLDCVQTRHDENGDWLVVERGAFVIACNLAPKKKSIPLPVGHHQLLITSAETVQVDTKTAVLPSDSVAILKRG